MLDDLGTGGLYTRTKKSVYAYRIDGRAGVRPKPNRELVGKLMSMSCTVVALL